tara:strand:- start:587 stop:1159 length:573 start_codon:yes stop_codon:yes gene_type:complete
MSRGLATDIVTEISKDAFVFADLVELHFSTPKFITNFKVNISTTTTTSGGAQTFTAAGELLSFDTIRETPQIKTNQINLGLSGTSSTFTNIFLNNDYVDTRVVIYRVFFNSSLVQIDSPVMLFDGEIQSFAINETGKTSQVGVVCSSVFYEFEKINGRRTNESSQQQFFANDRGMQYSSLTVEDIKWGKP